MVTLAKKDDETGFEPVENAVDDTAIDPERMAASVKIGEQVDAALECLTGQERTVFVMRHYHDMPLKEISQAMNVAEGTVKSLLFRGIRKLRERLSIYREELGLEDPAK